MSRPITSRKLQESEYSLYEEINPPPSLPNRTSQAIANSLQPNKGSDRSLRNRASASQNKTLPNNKASEIHKKTLKNNSPRANKRAPSRRESLPIQSEATKKISIINEPTSSDEKSYQENQNARSRDFYLTYLFFTVARALIEAFLYVLSKVLSEQFTNYPIPPRADQQEPSIDPLANNKPFLRKNEENLNPLKTNHSLPADHGTANAFISEDFPFEGPHADESSHKDLMFIPSDIPDKNIYGSMPLNSIKKGLIGFENPNRPPTLLSQEMERQIDSLKAPPYNITKWRPIAGDGNCYYRATMFGLIEQIIKNGNREQFSKLAEIFEAITPSLPKIDQPVHNYFVESLKVAAYSQRWETLDNFKQDIVDLKTGLDKAMIRAARYLVASEVEKLAGKPLDESGVTIESLIEESSLEEHCARIKKLGDYANGPHVNIGLLSRSLNFSLTLHTAAGNAGLFTLEQKSGYETEKVSILLIAEAQHYVLVYPTYNRA